jgi:hypothetical protein
MKSHVGTFATHARQSLAADTKQSSLAFSTEESDMYLFGGYNKGRPEQGRLTFDGGCGRALRRGIRTLARRDT